MKTEVPNHLVFGKHDAKKRRITKIVFSVFLIIEICLLWPVYPMMSDIYPLILGLPLSFFWVILMVTISFTTLLIYFLLEQKWDKEA